jgi:divalent metal cation (Fe/Co/Zn/Cd) transporter
MSDKLYYQAPSPEIYTEVRNVCAGIWMLYQDNEKADQVRLRKNIKDNFMYCVAELDEDQQICLFNNISEKAKKEISDRVKSVNPPEVVKRYYLHITI